MGVNSVLLLQVIKVYNEDNTSRAVEVPSDITARDICQLFVLKNHCIDDHSWTLFEHLSHLGIERTIEDHESVMEVLSAWGMDTDSRLYFRKNYAKYEFFRKPLDFFPDHMVSISSETNGTVDHSQLIQTFLNSSTCPEIHGHLHAKEQSRKSWKKFYFVLRRSGLYFSNKGTSKEPRHLQFIADFSDSDVYTVLSAKKLHGAPTDYGFCVKSAKCSSARDLKLLCADDEQTRTCWITAMRLLKYGMQLYQNFIQPHQKQKASPMRSISENSLVAMDFSGQKSRVIENPSEALSVAVEEGLSWRSISYEGQPKQPEDFCTVSVPHAENQTLSDLTFCIQLSGLAVYGQLLIISNGVKTLLFALLLIRKRALSGLGYESRQSLRENELLHFFMDLLKLFRLIDVMPHPQLEVLVTE
ncbi:hypothetical protein L3Q82_004350 [Scortum barcoo]|uniref:Uncharacterized protein n=1 Tax=Scortum barcoo TaxID=214431 RepID=A0ACB8VJU7_9TELE|nr:hypothetical protein L3Q82_004350 [Scortum barcoo]